MVSRRQWEKYLPKNLWSEIFRRINPKTADFNLDFFFVKSFWCRVSSVFVISFRRDIKRCFWRRKLFWKLNKDADIKKTLTVVQRSFKWMYLIFGFKICLNVYFIFVFLPPTPKLFFKTAQRCGHHKKARFQIQLLSILDYTCVPYT